MAECLRRKVSSVGYFREVKRIRREICLLHLAQTNPTGDLSLSSLTDMVGGDTGGRMYSFPVVFSHTISQPWSFQCVKRRYYSPCKSYFKFVLSRTTFHESSPITVTQEACSQQWLPFPASSLCSLTTAPSSCSLSQMPSWLQ